MKTQCREFFGGADDVLLGVSSADNGAFRDYFAAGGDHHGEPL